MTATVLLAALLVAPADSLLISADVLRDRLTDPNLVVLQVSMDRSEYDAGHLPGARFGNVMRFHGHQLADRLLPVPQLVDAVETLGISNRSRVVLVGDPMSAALVFVALDYLGHGDKTAVLDGGLVAWRAAGGEVTTQPVPDPSPAEFIPRVRQDLVVDADWVAAHRKSKSVALLDARTLAEYRGTSDLGQLPRPGHIPGARHLHWLDTVTDPSGTSVGPSVENAPVGARLKPKPELERMLTALGAGPDQELVVYCTVGMRASHLYYVARLLGRRVRLYVGSMADWSARSELPVEGPRS